MTLGFDRFSVVLDACVLFPMFTRDVLLTFADYGFFNPKWSGKIHDEWTSNLAARLREKKLGDFPEAQVDAVRAAMDRAFPDALTRGVAAESDSLLLVDPKDRHVVMTALAAGADAIVTFNLKDFAVDFVRKKFEIEVLHPDTFVRDLIDLNEPRAISAFNELRARKRRPPWTIGEMIERADGAGLVETAAWLSGDDVHRLL